MRPVKKKSAAYKKTAKKAFKKYVKKVATIKKAAYKKYKRIKGDVQMNYDDNLDINIV